MTRASANTSLHAAMVRDIRSGVPEGFDVLVREFGPDIQAVTFAITRNAQAAEDTAADSLVIAWREIGSLRDPARLRSWLMRIASRQALTYLRREARLPRLQDPELTGPGFEGELVGRIALADAVAQLPPGMRTVIVLRFVADLSAEEIGFAIGRSKNTVKNRSSAPACRSSDAST